MQAVDGIELEIALRGLLFVGLADPPDFSVEIAGSGTVIIPEARHGARPQTRKESPVQYLLLIYANEAGWIHMTPAQQDEGMAAYRAYQEALTRAGVLRGANR